MHDWYVKGTTAAKMQSVGGLLGDQAVNIFACIDDSQRGPQLAIVDRIPAIIVTVQHCLVLLQNLQSFLVHSQNIRLYMGVGSPVICHVSLEWRAFTADDGTHKLDVC